MERSANQVARVTGSAAHIALSRRAACEGIALTTTRAAYRGNNPVYVPINAPEVRWCVRACRHKNRPLNEDEQRFLDFLLEYCGISNALKNDLA